MMNIRRCARDLDDWGRAIKPKFRVEIANCKRQMADLRSKSDRSAVNHFLALRNRLSKLLVQEEVYWRQRGKDALA